MSTLCYVLGQRNGVGTMDIEGLKIRHGVTGNFVGCRQGQGGSDWRTGYGLYNAGN